MNTKPARKPAKPKEDAADRIYAAVQAAKAARPIGTPLTRDDAIAAIRAQLIVEGFIKKLVNGRNPHFDALAEACGYVGAVTKAGASQIAAALKGIREVEPNVTPEKLRRVATLVRRRYEGAGPQAVCVHWHEYAGTGTPRTAASRADPYTEPENWRAALESIGRAGNWDEAMLADLLAKPWLEIHLTLRQEILRELK